MHYSQLNVSPSYPIGAIYQNTAPQLNSPWVMPSNYKARLSVDGQKYEESIKVEMDPRVKTHYQELQIQHDLSMICYSNMNKCMESKKEEVIISKKDMLSNYFNIFSSLQAELQGSDMPPTQQMIDAVNLKDMEFKKLLGIN
jgi:hypothetical protein